MYIRFKYFIIVCCVIVVKSPGLKDGHKCNKKKKAKMNTTCEMINFFPNLLLKFIFLYYLINIVSLTENSTFLICFNSC